MQVQSYLFFDGRCEEAIEFYKKTLGAKVEMMMRFKKTPQANPSARPATRTRSCTPASASATQRSWRPTARKASRSSKVSALSLNAKDEADADRMFNALSDGGQVQMPLGKTFFSPRFGMVADKFGVGWMVIVEH